MDLSKAQWRKARRSAAHGGECVELAHFSGGVVAVRDSKRPGAGHFVLTPGAFAALLRLIKDAE